MQIEGATFPKIGSPFDVTTLFHLDGSVHISAIHQLLCNDDGEQAYKIVQPIGSLPISNRDELTSFKKYFPNLNGIKMLMLLHPFGNNISLT